MFTVSDHYYMDNFSVYLIESRPDKIPCIREYSAPFASSVTIIEDAVNKPVPSGNFKGSSLDFFRSKHNKMRLD
jgi:hypothetical protein